MIRQVKIGPLDFSVEQVDELHGHDEEGNEVPVMACCCVDSLTITLSKVPPIILQYKYLVHEMIEAYNTLYDIRLTHPQINQLEMMYFDMITSNAHLTEAIEEEVS